MTNSVLLAFNKILLPFSQAVRVLRSALTFEQRDLMVFAKCRRWVSSAKCKVSENLIAICRLLLYIQIVVVYSGLEDTVLPIDKKMGF